MLFNDTYCRTQGYRGRPAWYVWHHELVQSGLTAELVRSALGAKGLTGLALAMYVLPWVAWGAFQLCMYA